MSGQPTGNRKAYELYGDGELCGDADLVAPSARDDEGIPRRNNTAPQPTTTEEK